MEEFYCVSCSEIVTTRQEALLCDGCERWQHRRCGTGITRETYGDTMEMSLLQRRGTIADS